MKNISLALNAVLVVAVGILYYLHFKNPADASAAMPAPVVMPSGPAHIVYVNTDSLLDRYSFYKAKKAEFESKQERIKAELKNESEKLQKDAAEYQQRASVMTDADRQKTEEQLMARQQTLVKKKDDMLASLDGEQARFNEELSSRLTKFLKEYNKGTNYTFILGYQKGGGILFANDSLDITKQIVAGLNKEYEATKEK